MFEQYNGYGYTDYDYSQPLATHNPYLQEPEPEQHPRESGDRLLETCTRYGAFFCLGILVTLVVRLFGQLQPLFWLLAIAGLAGLGFAVHLTRRVELLAIALIIGASLVAGHWDYLAHGAQQAVQVVRQ